MKSLFSTLSVVFITVTLFSSCKRGSDATYISKKQTLQASAISDTLHGTLKGTLVQGKVYYMDGPVTINAGDTLFIQSGVTVNVISSTAYFYVKGTFISLGTSSAPNWITVPYLTGANKQDNLAAAQNPAIDSAFTSARNWCGIQCDTSCGLLVVKWTHIEFCGHNYVTPPISTLKSPSWAIYFSNPNGFMILEDSWIYGTVDDACRFAGGKICCMRNTFEKVSYTSGDCLNAKHGTVGIMAYNLFISTATNGTKASDKGSGSVSQCQIDMYNNTYVNGGWRQSSTAHGADLDYEQNARGQAYNNLLVNCKVGLRVVGNPVADTANLFYGNTFKYADSAIMIDQFYPTGNITKPMPTDIPNPSFLPTGYTLGGTYTSDTLAGRNNPMFVNFPLPCPLGYVIDYLGSADFHLQPGSPALNKGFTGFTPNNVVPVDPIYGASQITLPGKDIGCFQADGSGNRH